MEVWEMAISNETVLHKIENELQLAKQSVHQPEKLKQHMANIKLLSELILEGVQEKKEGGIKRPEQNKQTPPVHEKITISQPADKDGTSIFDF